MAHRACNYTTQFAIARLAQSAERKALNLVVVGSSPTVGAFARFWRNLHGAFLLTGPHCAPIPQFAPQLAQCSHAPKLRFLLLFRFIESLIFLVCRYLRWILCFYCRSFSLPAAFFVRVGFSFACLLFRSLVISYSFSLFSFPRCHCPLHTCPCIPW